MKNCRSCGPCSPTVTAALGVLEQCSGFLAGVDRTRYIAPCPGLLGSTIGQHVRHSLDHFGAVLGGLDGQIIDYDHRERQTPIERDPGAALHALHEVCDRLWRAAENELSGPVRVRVMLTADGGDTLLGSTLARELAFAAHHAVHHYAMMAAIAVELRLGVPEGFGKAPSTLNHERAGLPAAAAVAGGP